jgi:hypothetical protein
LEPKRVDTAIRRWPCRLSSCSTPQRRPPGPCPWLSWAQSGPHAPTSRPSSQLPARTCWRARTTGPRLRSSHEGRRKRKSGRGRGHRAPAHSRPPISSRMMLKKDVPNGPRWTDKQSDR